MKKLKVLLVFVLMISATIMNVAALEHEDNSFYVRTDISSDYDEYISSKFNQFLVAQSDIESYENIYLGKGIKVFLPEEFYDYYVYPVFIDNEIKSTIHISKDEDGFASTYTKAFAESLNNLKNQTTFSHPLSLIRQNSFIYAEINGQRTLIDHYDFSDNSSTLSSLPEVDTSGVPVCNVYSDIIMNEADNMIVTRAMVNKINWKVYETQGNHPWCASITTTNIVRNKGKNMTSSQMRSWLGDNDGLTNAQVANYLKNYHKYTRVKYTTSGSLAQSTLESNIDGGSAVFAHFADGSTGHAFAIIGYNNVANAYHIHNPWYNYTETMGYGGSYVTSTYKFKWTGGSVYNIYN